MLKAQAPVNILAALPRGPMAHETLINVLDALVGFNLYAASPRARMPLDAVVDVMREQSREASGFELYQVQPNGEIYNRRGSLVFTLIDEGGQLVEVEHGESVRFPGLSWQMMGPFLTVRYESAVLTWSLIGPRLLLSTDGNRLDWVILTEMHRIASDYADIVFPGDSAALA